MAERTLQPFHTRHDDMAPYGLRVLPSGPGYIGAFAPTLSCPNRSDPQCQRTQAHRLTWCTSLRAPTVQPSPALCPMTLPHILRFVAVTVPPKRPPEQNPGSGQRYAAVPRRLGQPVQDAPPAHVELVHLGGNIHLLPPLRQQLGDK
jgi:hypothetical protein